jgi:hypothetical protein
MANDARPLCLFCGHAMNIAESNRADIDLICFERQKLECPNCGGHDSRFAFLPEKAFSPSAILPASIVAVVQQSSSKPQVAEEVSQPKEIETDPTNSDGPTMADNRAERPPPQFQFAASQPLESHPVNPSSGEPQSLESVESMSLEPQTVKPRDASPAKNLSHLIQSYMAKWRGS